ncbi:MAG TPA: glycosyltransferase family 2 protein [Verrucomicrobiae bacterium]|nr:glycosyltransferase family 2 protein [Verrucomicrobiae bacterium]
MNSVDTNESAPLVSVVVVNYNCKRWLDNFFPALRAQTIFDRIEVILVDNTSNDGSAEICEREMKSWPNGIFLPTGGNYGFGGGCNRGAKIARGKYLFFVNPDIRPKPNCLEELARHADASELKTACPIILDYDSDNVQNAGSSGFDIFGCVVAPPLPEQPGKNLEQLFASATFFFIRRDFFEKLCGFDEEFFLYSEEMDLSWRTWLAGESVTLIPCAQVHHQFASNQQNRTSEAKRFYANRNQLLTLLKNSQGLLLPLVFTYITLIGTEAVAGAILARKPSFIPSSFFKPMLNVWRLRHHVLTQRQFIKTYRQRGDWWIARHFFRFQFGHWGDIKRSLQKGIVIDKSSIPAKKRQTSAPR